MSKQGFGGTLLGLWALASACGSDPTEGNVPPEPTAGSLELTVSTTGRDFDPDGYTVAVDAGSPLAVSANDTVSVSDLDPGVHTVTLAGLASNCALATPTPLEVTVPGAAGAVAVVEVICTAIYTLAYRGASGVELTDAAGTVHRTLVQSEVTPGSSSVADPLVWSPDGRFLAISKNVNGAVTVWLANVDDGSFNQLSSYGERETVWNTVGVWSPDGSELLLETMLVSNTSPTALTRYPLDKSSPPQGIYGVVLGMTGEVACQGRGRGVLWPDWSPDGSQIVICEGSQTSSSVGTGYPSVS